MQGVHEAVADELRAKGEVTIYRMPTVALRQSLEGRYPESFERGRMADFAPVVNAAQVFEMADTLATTLGKWRLQIDQQDGNSSAWFADTWAPNRDEWALLVARDRDVALAALALARWARLRPDHTGAQTASELAETALHELAQQPMLDRPTLAIMAVAASELWPGESAPTSIIKPHRMPMIAESAGGGEEPTRAIATLALARAGDVDAVRQSISDWSGRSPGTLVNTLPWSLHGARSVGETGLDPQLEQLLDVFVQAQLDATGGSWGPEAAGAIPLSRDSSAMGMPSLRAAWAGASLMGDIEPVRRALLKPRIQLLATHLKRRIIDSNEAALFASPDQALHRIRLAPWDERTSIAAQSLGVLTALELAEALKEIE